MNEKLAKKEMQNIVGGTIASSMINAITKAVTAIYNLGVKAGSSIRRLTTGKYCPVR